MAISFNGNCENLNPLQIFLQITGWGLGALIKWISKTYHGIPIIITENGMSDNGTSLADDLRIEQIQVSIKIIY